MAESQNGNLARNPNYWVAVQCNQPELKVIFNLPENLMYSLASQWEQPLGGSLGGAVDAGLARIPKIGGLASSASGIARSLGNFNPVIQAFTHQVWQGSSPVEFSFLATFDAVENAYTDVVKPITDLSSLSLPWSETSDTKDAVLFPPGPSLAQPDRGRISLRIGNFMYIHSMVVTNVVPTWDSRFDPFGNSVSATAEISLSTINNPSRDEFASFFISGGRPDNTNYGTYKSEEKPYGT